MRQIREILRQKWALQLSHRAVAGSLGVGLGTISSVVTRAEAAGLDWAQIEPLTETVLESRLYGRPEVAGQRQRPWPDCAWIHAERAKPGVTLELLHLEYLERHPDGYRYTQFCDIYRRWLKRRGLSMRQVHRAGEKMFVDYAGQKPHLVDPTTGEVRTVELFVAVLGASNYTYAEATLTQQVPDWLASHQRAFSFFGGVTSAVVCDYVSRHIITVMCPAWLRGRSAGQEVSAGRSSSVRPHNHHSEFSQASNASSVRQTGVRGNAAEETGGSQSRRAASLAWMLISA
jgi:hypothetical protein